MLGLGFPVGWREVLLLAGSALATQAALGAFFGQSGKSEQVIPLRITIRGPSSQPRVGVTFRQTDRDASTTRDDALGAGKNLLNRFRSR